MQQSGPVHESGSAPGEPGQRMLIVEDMGIVAAEIERLVVELGWVVVRSATTLSEAVQAAKNGGFDAALLDINLRGEQVFHVAEMLKARGTPFVFLTGYGKDVLPPEMREYPCLEKPFTRAQLAAVLDEQSLAQAGAEGMRPQRRAAPAGRSGGRGRRDVA